eukprot:CAMPEP_0184363848 /NCGR_PEP_ID=MMETSP1089-20130417/141614_1 /TAXON_ID=38269 ORGANISM="Gloeochaete wittrockiana, Strain SAG46.84" /NCGR_SAMPLE_ID=MMETSP1089 /ASSEMBLY_ACC=CAM_ASM_000445 /LENGTH=103 /DNA_ID=CAMNT_0026704501 /DNA_START=29 /DNA_END=336 /DNA_ORIENTATION=-
MAARYSDQNPQSASAQAKCAQWAADIFSSLQKLLRNDEECQGAIAETILNIMTQALPLVKAEGRGRTAADIVDSLIRVASNLSVANRVRIIVTTIKVLLLNSG